ncbi:MAG: ORF6N domain-containing protein [Bacteroidales bacterium]|nr:ORF6N domain-containing protein [Bacteroidales bacterium]
MPTNNLQHIDNHDNLKKYIYEVRGVKVMLDADLATIYGYTTKAFNQQVKNNIQKFDEDFRFQLAKEEYENILRSKKLTLENNSTIYISDEKKIDGNLMSKNLTSSWGGTRKPFRKANGIFHDRYIILDYGTATEKKYHCGASSKDAGKKVNTITEVKDRNVYHPLVDALQNNPMLTI